MRKFLPFSRRQPSLDRYTVNKSGWNGGHERVNAKSMRRTSAASLNAKSIQVVRGAYHIDLNKVDSSFTKLHRACLLNDDTLVKKHILKVDNNSHDSSKRYPIHLATVNGNSSIVKLLIENNANPNVQDNESNTPLIKAIECGHEHLVKYLLSNGADPNISDQENNTALHWAIMTEGMIAIDALLASKKCDLSLCNNKDETCLHLAVRSPLINGLTFELMASAGADLEAKDQLGLTPLDIAQACNNLTAINAFNQYRNAAKAQEPPNNANNNGDIDDNQLTITKICEEYKLKYITKNRENLEYEKKLIQLNGVIQRLRLHMGYLKENCSKLKQNNDSLLDENSKLTIENKDLKEQLRLSREEGVKTQTKDETDPAKACLSNKNMDLEGQEPSGRLSHEEFSTIKANLQDRINKLKMGLPNPTQCSCNQASK